MLRSASSRATRDALARSAPRPSSVSNRPWVARTPVPRGAASRCQTERLRECAERCSGGGRRCSGIRNAARPGRTAIGRTSRCSPGAPGRIRTCDARFRKPMLYPLSYGSGAGAKRGRKPRSGRRGPAGTAMVERRRPQSDRSLAATGRSWCKLERCDATEPVGCQPIRRTRRLAGSGGRDGGVRRGCSRRGRT